MSLTRSERENIKPALKVHLLIAYATPLLLSVENSRVSRVSVIQSFVDCFEHPNYLEVGVEDGFTFHAIRAERKVAVDPEFRFEMPHNAVTDRLEYHQIPSDNYFGARALAEPKFDVIFLDGLHTFEQILRDVLNAIECLADDGAIVIDDVWPTSYAASLPDTGDMFRVREARPDGSVAWMGDVYRVVQFIDTFLQQFRFACTDQDPWQMVMWRNPRSTVTERQVRDIAELSYADLLKQKGTMNFQPLGDIIAAYLADHPRG